MGRVAGGYPLNKLYEEIAFLAYYFHWGHEDILELDHKERRRYCAEISRINSRLNEDGERRNVFDV